MRFPASTLLSEQTLRRALGISALSLAAAAASAQGNSPYSRYGLGDLAPGTHISNRAMGGISAGDADYTHINFSNPASYSQFMGVPQARNKNRLSYGRVLFDVGANIDQKTLREPGRPDKFSSSEINFSYIQVGIPLRRNWGLVFGIRPMSRVSYMIQRKERLPNGDSVFTEFSGSGGAYLPSIGMGKAFGGSKAGSSIFSIGANMGYLFGNRESNSERYFNNDSVAYYQALYRSNSSFGKLFFNFGAQYFIPIGAAKDSLRAAKGDKPMNRFLRLGVSGNMRQSLKGSQDVTVGTFTFDPNSALTDTVLSRKDQEGTVVYPSSVTAGFLTGGGTSNGGFWTAGADVVFTQWSAFRYFGSADAVTNNVLFRAGGEFIPDQYRIGFLRNTRYRAGFAVGKDYVTAGGELPFWSATAGFGIQLGHRNPQYRNQVSMVNLAFEYLNRGNNSNTLKENNFRISIGLTLSDSWFVKRRYD
ncbi:MAG: hypothetical protein EOO15_15995 [Chitinophagaceae bacterium]|nr:MAG: hypothetical protein EOO15_15995 [Chitinophagaceae bacterium]